MKNINKEFNSFATKSRGINSLTMFDYSKNMNRILVPTSMTPNVIEERKMNAVSMDVFSRLMMDRIIFLGTPIDDTISNIIVAQLLFLESADPKRDIQIYINSPGGVVTGGCAILDTMEYIRPEISTLVAGMAASMAFVVAVSGAKGKRFALKHSRLMQHQPSGGVQGDASSMEITFKEIKKHQKDLYEIISEKTGQPYKKIEKDSDRDYWMTAAEAKEYGAIDEVVGRKK